MAPRPRGPRLRDLDPEVFAADVAMEFRDAAGPVLKACGSEDLSLDPREMPAHAALYALCSHAQYGHDVAYWAARARSDLALLAPVFALLPSGDLETPLGLVRAATEARLAIDARSPVEIAGIAALAGLHPQRVRALAARGALRRLASGPIQHASALVFLRAHDVPGLLAMT